MVSPGESGSAGAGGTVGTTIGGAAEPEGELGIADDDTDEDGGDDDSGGGSVAA